jgi:hypothetical protein
MSEQPWAYLEKEPAPDAPLSDNLSGLYCAGCRGCGFIHCAWPEYCGGMRRMKPAATGLLGDPAQEHP